MSSIIISELLTYPLKGTQGISSQIMTFADTGPEYDRSWVLVGNDGRFISQRTHPKLCLIKTEINENYLKIFIPDVGAIVIEQTCEGEPFEAVIWKDTCLVVEASKEASSLISDFLETSCRLVKFANNSIRPVNPKYKISENDQVGFADAFPVLLISQSSLDDLNQRLEKPVPMNRFRPNIVVTGSAAFAEDSWSCIRIGSLVLYGVKQCSRCIVTTIDQKTAERGKEPFKTLATYRNSEKGIMFGMNMIHESTGTIQVGDTVEILR
ncbi:MAG: MOSC domain-containing protein [Alphaproteobacteria bacterium]|nr:MOSC domain-containing protein [Alphaproteobacteria bacterium]